MRDEGWGMKNVVVVVVVVVVSSWWTEEFGEKQACIFKSFVTVPEWESLIRRRAQLNQMGGMVLGLTKVLRLF